MLGMLVLYNLFFPEYSVSSWISQESLKSYISVITRFARGVLSKVSANFGLNDISINAVSRKKVFIVCWPWITITSWINNRSGRSRQIIKVCFKCRSSWSLEIPCGSLMAWSRIVHYIILTFSQGLSTSRYSTILKWYSGIGNALWWFTTSHIGVHHPGRNPLWFDIHSYGFSAWFSNDWFSISCISTVPISSCSTCKSVTTVILIFHVTMMGWHFDDSVGIKNISARCNVQMW